MQLCARDNGFARFEAMENHYNLLYREDERELIPICRQFKIYSDTLDGLSIHEVISAAMNSTG